jgi:hypothetical protein
MGFVNESSEKQQTGLEQKTSQNFGFDLVAATFKLRCDASCDEFFDSFISATEEKKKMVKLG